MDNSVCEEKNYNRTYNENSEKLRNFIYYKCGDLKRAEDLMHEAFVRLWKNCEKVILEKVTGYLFTTANRLFLNEVEHEKVKLRFEKETTNTYHTVDPHYELEEAEFKKILEEAISALPETQREVFLMNKIDKLSFQEIADLQGVSLSAVHKKMYKAMDKLKDTVKILQHKKI